MCGLWTRPLADSDPHNFLDLRIYNGSFVPVDENLWMRTPFIDEYYLLKPRLISIAQFAITINSNVCPHIRVVNTLMRDVIGIRYFRSTLGSCTA